jgi:hypothetical protein
MIDPPLADAIAKQFRGVAPATLIAAVVSVIALGDAHQMDLRERLRPFVAALPAEAGPLKLALGIGLDDLGEWSAPSRDAEIGDLYAELRSLAGGAAGEPGREARYRQKLARLRELQEAEAQEMSAAFEARRLLPAGTVDEVLARADAILQEHDASTRPDPTGDDPA